MTHFFLNYMKVELVQENTIAALEISRCKRQKCVDGRGGNYCIYSHEHKTHYNYTYNVFLHVGTFTCVCFHETETSEEELSTNRPGRAGI